MAKKATHRLLKKHQIWHTVDKRYYGDGAEVDLSHLSAEDIKKIEAAGIVEPLVAASVASKPEEVKK